MTPEEKARRIIDEKLCQAGWVIQDMNRLNLAVSLGVAVREFPTSTGEVDYALFIDGEPAGVVEAKREEAGQSITDVEIQSGRYAHSTFKWVRKDYFIRFAYEATDKLIRFTDYKDIKYRSRTVFSFHRPETLRELLRQPDTIRNNMKHFPVLDETGFRKCQVNAIKKLEESFADNRPKALVQMATGAGKTFTAITASYRLLKYGKINRILFLVDTKGLGEQAEREFLAYTPTDDPRSFSQIYGVRRLTSSYIPGDVQVCISTIQRMYSILKGEELDESAEETSFAEFTTAESKAPKEVVYNEKYPPEFFDVIIVDECHRSIYNVWSQVLSYFDAFVVGLTATPDNRTFAFFNENIVSEYPREQAIVDGVNVGEDIFLIETNVGKNGGHLMKQLIEYRDRLSRAKRWKQLVSMKQVNNYKHKALCIETNDFIVNVGRTNSEHKLLPTSAYKREYAKANAGLSTQLSFDFLNDTPKVVESKKYAEITYGYRYGDMTHLYIVLPSSDYKGIEHSTNLLEDIKIYENYVPEDLVEESIVSLKKSLSKEIEKII